MWSASFYFGNFVGPTASGLFVDAWGFKYTTLLLFLVYIFSLVIDSLELLYNMNKSFGYGHRDYLTIERDSQKTEKVELLANN